MSKLLLERFLVFAVCLALPFAAVANSISPQPELLTIFVKGTTTDMDVVRQEVARLMQPAGFVVEWRSMSDRRLGEDYARLVTVDFRGACSATAPIQGSAAPVSRESLASTAIVDGKVLPFATVHCDTLRQMMTPVLASTPRDDRGEIFGRAAARVLAHELFHMLAQTKAHGVHGVSKSCFGLADLTAEQFHFDPVTLAQMRPVEQEPAVESDFGMEADVSR